MPSDFGYFGSGFVQGLGQSLQQLPALLQARADRQQQKDELALKKAILDKQDKLLQLKLEQLGKDPSKVIGEIMAQLNGPQGAGIAAPAPPPTTGLKDSLVGMPDQQDASVPPVDLSTAAPAVPQQSPATAGGKYDVEGLSFDPTDPTSMNIRIGKRNFKGELKPVELPNGQVQFMNLISDEQGNLVKQVPIEGFKPVPPDALLAAREQARSLGAPDGALDSIAGSLLAAQNIPDAETRTAQLQAIQQQAQQLGQIGKDYPDATYDIKAPDIGESVKRGQKTAAEGAGLKTGAEAKARAAVEEETAAATAEARSRGEAAAQLRPAKKLISRLSDLLDGIKLPTKGSERLSEAPRLAGESFSQSNQNIVLYETLKNGFLATLARAAGERGVLTDQDTARAKSLFPVVVPGIGMLPDKKETAQNKLKQLEGLLEEFVTRDPGLSGAFAAQDGKGGSTSGGFQLQKLVPTR